MGYTLTEAYDYGLDLLDKKGSDFVQLPEFFRVFKSATLDFIGERIPAIEQTQQVTSDLRSLVKTEKRICTDDPVDVYAKIAAIPNDCHHLFRVNPQFPGGFTGRRPKLIRHGNFDALNADPHNRPSASYPLILQYLDYVKVHSGYDDKAELVYMTYVKKPRYADINQPDQLAVDLPTEVQDAIIIKAVASLMKTRADQRAQFKTMDDLGHRDSRR